MKIEVLVKTDGTVVTSVMDRGQHLCSEVYRVTNSVGRQLSDEETGPDGDKVNEINNG